MRLLIVCLTTLCAIAFVAAFGYGRVASMPAEKEQAWRQRELAFLISAHERIEADLAHQPGAAASLSGEDRAILQAMAVAAKPMSDESVPDKVKVLLTKSDLWKDGTAASKAEPAALVTGTGSSRDTGDAGPKLPLAVAAEPTPATASLPVPQPVPAAPVPELGPTTEAPRPEAAAPRSLAQLQEQLHAEKTDRGLRVRFPADVLFGAAGDTLDRASDGSLSDVLELVKAVQPREIVVVGLTDSTGKRDRDPGLSKRRAQAVSSWLTAHGLDEPPDVVTRTAPRRNQNATGVDNFEAREPDHAIEILLRRR